VTPVVFAYQGDDTKVAGHYKLSLRYQVRVTDVSFGSSEAVRRYQVQIDGSEISCHDEIVSVRAKNLPAVRQVGPPTPKLQSRETKLPDSYREGCHNIL